MRKIFTVIFTLIISLLQAQFTIAEKTSEWNQVSKYDGDLILYSKDNLLKVKLKDVRSVKMSSVFNTSRTVFDDIYKEQKKSNEGIKDGYYEMVFSSDSGTLDEMYKIIEDNLRKKNLETITLNFPEGNLHLRFYKDIFQCLVSFGIDNKENVIYSDGYSLSGIKNVFAKNKK